jgi:predicted acetyltransferase
VGDPLEKNGCAASAGSAIKGGVPQLSLPVDGVHRSFLDAMAEFRAEGRGDVTDRSMIGSELREFGDRWATSEGFAAYVGWLRAQSLDDTPRPEGYVPSTTLWFVEGPEYLGRLAIRHRLTAQLLEFGGHIGYDVRPAARRRGYATAMLRAALPMARDLGISSALVTCDVTNVASRKVIEASGGAFEDQRGEKLRYWVPTAQR